MTGAGAGLALAFLVTAALYASVGFGGGSTYSALLALAGTDYRVLPVLSLACNIVVVAGGSWRFARAGVTPWRGALTLIALAAPAAFLGGLTPIGENAFLLLLGASLCLMALAMLIPVSRRKTPSGAVSRYIAWVAIPLGYLAGLVGIGGGIFLAPLLHLARWQHERAIAATASLFILVNSLFGLAGQLAKSGAARFAEAMGDGWVLILAVALGGWVGSTLALKALPGRWIRGLTALLVGAVGVRLILGQL